MSKIAANVTRLELVIIVVALLVLLYSNQSPQPGSADVRPAVGEMAVDVQDAVSDAWPDNLNLQEVTASPKVVSPPIETKPAADSTPDNPPTVSIPQPRPPVKRYARVDARNSPTLKYPEIMYGEVTVRWVWNGTRLEAHTVCEVQEKDGTISIWTLDGRHEGVVITPLPLGQEPPY